MFFLIFLIFTTSTVSVSQAAPRKFIGKFTGVNLTRSHPLDINTKNYPNIIQSFVFPNANLKDVIKVMSTDLNINIIMNPDLGSKRISIISYSPITVAEAYQAFLSALALHDLTVIRSGSFLKVVTKDKALQSNSYVYTGNKRVNSDQFLTSIIKLKHIDAKSLEKNIKPLIDSKAVKSLIFYPPSNTVIISDYGLNVDKIKKIIKLLDVPSQDTIFKVFPIKHAIASMLSQTISNLLLRRGSNRLYNKSWTNTRMSPNSTGTNQSIEIKSVSSDKRTNSIIAIGNKGGIEKIQKLIQQLDRYKSSELSGDIYVYRVEHGIAKDIAITLNKLMKTSKEPQQLGASIRNTRSYRRSTRRGGRNINLQSVNTAQSFQGVRIIADINTNSLLIVSNKYNYDTLLKIIKQIDIPRNQVFVKSVIMELSTDKTNNWQMANYFFKKGAGGIARMGYGLSSLSDLASATSGATLLFPLSVFLQKTFLNITPNSQTDISSLLMANGINAPGGALKVPTLSSFIKFLQKTVGANILSTPQIMALDHQEARVSIVQKIPVVGDRTTSSNGQFTNSTKHVSVETALTITPHINPDVNSIRLKIEQKIDNIVADTSVPEELQKTNVAIKKRVISTFITLKDNETAVLGGLVKEFNSTIISKIPLLGDLPFVGWLFKNSTTEKKKTNLIVFITPHIIHSATEHKTLLNNKLKERIKFIRKFTGKQDPYQDTVNTLLKSNNKSSSYKEELSNTVDSNNNTINNNDTSNTADGNNNTTNNNDTSNTVDSNNKTTSNSDIQLVDEEPLIDFTDPKTY